MAPSTECKDAGLIKFTLEWFPGVTIRIILTIINMAGAELKFARDGWGKMDSLILETIC